MTSENDESRPVSEAPPPAPRAYTGEETAQPWTVGEAIGVAMTSLKRSASVLPLFGLVVIAVLALVGAVSWFGGVYQAIVDVTNRSPFSKAPVGLPPEIVLRIALAVGGGFLLLQVGMAMLFSSALHAVRQERIPAGDLLRSIARVPELALFSLIFIVLLLIPSGLLALPFALTPFFMLDQRLGLFTAMKRSWRKSKESVGTLWLYFVALSPLLLLGVVSGLIAILTVPIQVLGLAYVYVRVTGRNHLPWFPPEYASRSIRTFLKVTFGALSILLLGLTYWVSLLPTLRGAAFSLKDTAIRASAIIMSVGAVIVFLALLLPYALDRLEGRRFTSFVAARHVRSQKSGFLTVISILSICGVAISSCALSSVVSVMGGFSQDLKRKILGNNAHIVIDTTSAVPFDDYESIVARVQRVPGVVGAAPVVHGEVMASSASNLAGVVVTGVEPQSIESVIDLKKNMEVGKLDYLEHPELLTHLPANEVIGIGPGGEQYFRGPDLNLDDDLKTQDIDPDVKAVILNKDERPGIILGRELAKTLHVYVSDEITLVSPLGDLGPMGIMPRTKKFRVAGIFYSGMYEYDATYVYTMKESAQQYFELGEKINAIEVKIDDAERADRVTPLVAAAVQRPELRVRDWREINKNLFSALKLERFATFIILSIAIMVASFCIVCTLLLMVTEKGKEIAILKAIGASDGAILRTFMMEGMIIGGIGTVFGVVTGLSVCTGLSWFGLRLDPDVYYIDRLPISVNGWDFLTVAVAAFTICTLSTLYPAFAASRLRPVDGLRYE